MTVKALSRRLFMKALPAAPLAAPSIASDFVGGMNAPVAPIGYSLSAEPNISKEWALQKRAELERIISGNLTEDEKLERQRQDYRSVAYHYDSLRSVSPVMRSKFHSRAVETMQHQDQKNWAIVELKRLLAAAFR